MGKKKENDGEETRCSCDVSLVLVLGSIDASNAMDGLDVGTCQNVCLVLVLPRPGYRGPLAYEHGHTVQVYAMHHHHCYAVHSRTNGIQACKGIGAALLLYCVLPWYGLGTPVEI